MYTKWRSEFLPFTERSSVKTRYIWQRGDIHRQHPASGYENEEVAKYLKDWLTSCICTTRSSIQSWCSECIVHYWREFLWCYFAQHYLGSTTNQYGKKYSSQTYNGIRLQTAPTVCEDDFPSFNQYYTFIPLDVNIGQAKHLLLELPLITFVIKDVYFNLHNPYTQARTRIQTHTHIHTQIYNSHGINPFLISPYLSEAKSRLVPALWVARFVKYLFISRNLLFNTVTYTCAHTSTFPCLVRK